MREEPKIQTLKKFKTNKLAMASFQNSKSYSPKSDGSKIREVNLNNKKYQVEK